LKSFKRRKTTNLIVEGAQPSNYLVNWTTIIIIDGG
jgi:hypothetical protein